MKDWERERYLTYSRLNSFQKKVRSAQKIIESAFAKFSSWAVSCSFGKDSLVLLDLVFSVRPCAVIFKDSGYCLPETYATMQKCKERYGFKTQVKQADMTWEEILDRFGLPGINRTDAQQKKAVQAIKKDVLTEFAKELGFMGIFWGLRSQEAKGREMLLRCKGHTFLNETTGLWYCAPLHNWTADDVWAYIISRDLPYPKFYDYQQGDKARDWIRNTGWASTDGASRGRLVWLKRYYPDLYKKLSAKFPEVRNYV